MPRPFKCRWVSFKPVYTFFKPAGIPFRELEVVSLTLDELEAIRLADLEGLYHEDCARRMNISRQTFGNILDSAHKKIADFLINGKVLKIEGGNIKIIPRRLRCFKCKHEFEVPYFTESKIECLNCHSDDVQRVEDETDKEGEYRFCRRRRKRMGTEGCNET